MPSSKQGLLVKNILGIVPERKSSEAPSLPKCKYPESIKAKLIKSLDSTDWFAPVKYYTGAQPLEYLPQNESEIENVVVVTVENLDGTFVEIASEPYLNDLRRGIDDLNDFAYNYLRQNKETHCKDGFEDLILAEFTRLYNPSKFKDFASFLKKDLEQICVPYEDNKVCDVLPLDPDDFVQKVGELALEVKNSFESSH